MGQQNGAARYPITDLYQEAEHFLWSQCLLVATSWLSRTEQNDMKGIGISSNHIEAYKEVIRREQEATNMQEMFRNAEKQILLTVLERLEMLPC